jgi:hypothetical protein
VIGNAADHFRSSLGFANDTADVSVQLITPVRVNYWQAVLGAENNMIMEAKMGGGHGGMFFPKDPPPLPGRVENYTPVPVAGATG